MVSRRSTVNPSKQPFVRSDFDSFEYRRARGTLVFRLCRWPRERCLVSALSVCGLQLTRYQDTFYNIHRWLCPCDDVTKRCIVGNATREQFHCPVSTPACYNFCNKPKSEKRKDSSERIIVTYSCLAYAISTTATVNNRPPPPVRVSPLLMQLAAARIYMCNSQSKR